MRKRILSILMIATAAIAFTSCNDKDKDDNGSGKDGGKKEFTVAYTPDVAERTAIYVSLSNGEFAGNAEIQDKISYYKTSDPSYVVTIPGGVTGMPLNVISITNGVLKIEHSMITMQKWLTTEEYNFTFQPECFKPSTTVTAADMSFSMTAPQ